MDLVASVCSVRLPWILAHVPLKVAALVSAMLDNVPLVGLMQTTDLDQEELAEVIKPTPGATTSLLNHIDPTHLFLGPDPHPTDRPLVEWLPTHSRHLLQAKAIPSVPFPSLKAILSNAPGISFSHHDILHPSTWPHLIFDAAHATDSVQIDNAITNMVQQHIGKQEFFSPVVVLVSTSALATHARETLFPALIAAGPYPAETTSCDNIVVVVASHAHPSVSQRWNALQQIASGVKPSEIRYALEEAEVLTGVVERGEADEGGVTEGKDDWFGGNGEGSVGMSGVSAAGEGGSDGEPSDGGEDVKEEEYDQELANLEIPRHWMSDGPRARKQVRRFPAHDDTHARR